MDGLGGDGGGIDGIGGLGISVSAGTGVDACVVVTEAVVLGSDAGGGA